MSLTVLHNGPRGEERGLCITLFSAHMIGLTLPQSNRIWFLFYTYTVSLNPPLPLFSSLFSQYDSSTLSCWGEEEKFYC